MTRKRNLIVAVTGASGAIYARLLGELLAGAGGVGEIALIVTANGASVAAFEGEAEWFSDARFTRYRNDDLFAPPASGSAAYDGMAIVPCTMGHVGRIAAGVSDDLVSRAADVTLKERRTLVVVPREMPLGTIHLRNLTALSEAGAIVCPASPAFYGKPESREVLCRTVAERTAALLGVDVPRYRWNGGR